MKKLLNDTLWKDGEMLKEIQVVVLTTPGCSRQSTVLPQKLKTKYLLPER